jgi:hypothetical protein
MVPFFSLITNAFSVVRCPCTVPVCEGEAGHAQDWHPALQGQGQGGQGPPAVQEVGHLGAIEQNHTSTMCLVLIVTKNIISLQEVLVGHGEPADPLLPPQGPLHHPGLCCFSW